MDVTQAEAVCAGLPGAWPDNPWEHEHPVHKVGEPVEAVEESYRLVVSRLPKRDRPEGWETVSDDGGW